MNEYRAQQQQNLQFERQLIVKIRQITQLKVIMESMYIEIGISRDGRREIMGRTKVIYGKEGIWDQQIQYVLPNNDEFDLLLEVKNQKDIVIGSNTIINLLKHLQHAHWQSLTSKYSLFNQKYKQIGIVSIQIIVYYSHQPLTAILVPNLSLINEKRSVIKTNAIDNIKAQKLNCFSLMDDDILEGFDEIQFFPNKYKILNTKQSETKIRK